MRIAVLVTRFPALSETFVIQQVEGLLARGHDVRIFARRSGDGLDRIEKKRLDLLLARTTFFDRDDMPTWRRLLSAAAALAKLALRHPGGGSRLLRLAARDHDPVAAPLARLACHLQDVGGIDAVLCHFGPSGRLAAFVSEAGVLRAPIATVFHGYDLTSHLRNKPEDYYARLFDRGAAFLPISERFAAVLRERGCPTERIHVHHMGIDAQALEWRPPAPPGRPMRLLSIARLVEKKGIGYGLEALAHLRKQGHDVHYTVVGDGPLRDELEKRAAELGVSEAFDITGWAGRDEVAHRLREADVFLTPSVTAASGDEEGIPVVLMEAMACGVPVIATRHAGIPELVRDGHSGLLVEERDAEGLAAAVSRMLADEGQRSAFSRAAREVVTSEFECASLDDALARRLAEMTPPTSA